MTGFDTFMEPLYLHAIPMAYTNMATTRSVHGPGTMLVLLSVLAFTNYWQACQNHGPAASLVRHGRPSRTNNGSDSDGASIGQYFLPCCSSMSLILTSFASCSWLM